MNDQIGLEVGSTVVIPELVIGGRINCPQGMPTESGSPKCLQRSQWNSGMSLAGLIELRTSVDGILRQIRHERHILPPVNRCRKCGRIGRAAEPKVSVWATILALARFGIASPTVAKKLEKE